MTLQSQFTPLKNKNLNGLTHFSLRRLWFTCKAPANSCTPSDVISFSLRLKNVREQEKERYRTTSNLMDMRKIIIMAIVCNRVHKISVIQVSEKLE